jgi:hypothetical protein
MFAKAGSDAIAAALIWTGTQVVVITADAVAGRANKPTAVRAKKR